MKIMLNELLTSSSSLRSKFIPTGPLHAAPEITLNKEGHNSLKGLMWRRSWSGSGSKLETGVGPGPGPEFGI